MRAKHGQFTAAIALALLVWWKPLQNFAQIVFSREEYSYIILVMAVAAVLLWIGRWPHAPPEPGRSTAAMVIGLFAIVAGAWLSWQSSHQDQDSFLSLSILLLVIFVLAAFFLVYGHSAFTRMRFPFFLLFLAVPLPRGAVSWLVVVLQHGSAYAANILFQIFRVPVVRNGLVFSLSNLDVEVAEECSGIRSSTVLFVTTLVLAQVFLKSRRDRIIAVICSLPIAIAKNGIRIFTLSVLGEYVSTDWLEGSLHRKGGFVFFTIGMAMVLGVIWYLRRREHTLAGSSPR